MEVPAPELRPTYDVSVHFRRGVVAVCVTTSLQGTRSAKEFLDLLKENIMPDDFHLESLHDKEVVDAQGVLHPGEYIIVGAAQEYNWRGVPLTWKKEASILRGTGSGKKRKLSTTDPEAGQSQRDKSQESVGFKSRLIARDKGCVVCMAQNIGEDSLYLYEGDSELFIGAHIFALQYHDLWDQRRYREIVDDPFSVPGASTSSTNRQSTDTRRMNSLDNGLLLCVKHHIQFDAHMFSIHPETHTVTSFHPHTRSIYGLVITQPWLNGSQRYPPPHSTLLKDHFMASIAKWMSAASEEYEEEDSLEDEDELPELV